MQTLAFSEFAWHQSLACMQGHCHATERQRTGLQTTGSQLIPRPRLRQARLRTTPFGHAFRPHLPATLYSHAFRPRLPTCHSDRGRYVFGRTGCSCAAMSYQLHFHLLLTERTNNVTTPNRCREITWMFESRPRGLAELVSREVRCCDYADAGTARSTRIAKRQITQRAASQSCPESFQ